MPPYAADRHRQIIQRLEAHGRIVSVELAREFEVSLMTIWRDLQSLEERGLLRRMHGGALLLRALEEAAYEEKMDLARGAKDAIARYVADTMIIAGTRIILDGGTTISALARQQLPDKVTFLTNSVPVALAMQKNPGSPSTMLSGGLLRSESGTMVGRDALRFFGLHPADLLLMSATAVSIEQGVLDPNPLEIEVKLAMMAAAKRTVLLADASKFERISVSQTTDWNRIDCLVTDLPGNAPATQALQSKGVQVFSVSV